jgi:hypothetical protein
MFFKNNFIHYIKEPLIYKIIDHNFIAGVKYFSTKKAGYAHTFTQADLHIKIGWWYIETQTNELEGTYVLQS